jgi:hypothetical protein
MNADLLPVLLAALAAIGVAVAAMSIGVILRRPCLRGSCGGANACEGCPNRPRDAG